MSTQPNELTQDTQPNQPTRPPNQPTLPQEQARLLQQEFDLLVDYLTRLEGIVMSQPRINRPGEGVNIRPLELLRQDMSEPQTTVSHQTPTFEGDPMEELKRTRRQERHRSFKPSEQLRVLGDQFKRLNNIAVSHKIGRYAMKEDLDAFDYEFDKVRVVLIDRYNEWTRNQKEIGSYLGLV